MAQRVGGAAAVREELPGLQGHGEHLTSVSTAQASLLCLSDTDMTNATSAKYYLLALIKLLLFFCAQ